MMKKTVFKEGDIVDIVTPKYSCPNTTIVEINEFIDSVKFFHQGMDEYQWLRTRFCKLKKDSMTTEKPKMSIVNWEIAQFCGVKSVPQGSVNYNWLQVDDKNHPLSVLNHYLDDASNMRFDKNWNLLMGAVRYIADMEKIPLIAMLCKLAGKHGNSIQDVHENLYEYIKTAKETCPI